MRIATLFLVLSTIAVGEVWQACPSLCKSIQACAEKVDHADMGDLLCLMAKCEIGDRCQPNTRSPSGKFHGAFQFLPATWKSVCAPIFKKKQLKQCTGKKAMYDSCCATMCASEIIATEANGGIRNWPACGKRAKRELTEIRGNASLKPQ